MQIEFNGQAYKLDTLVSLIGFGRQEKVSVQDIVIIKGSACKSKLPVCHVYDGKMYLLAGEIDTSKESVNVCILTKHVLKKALMSSVEAVMDMYVAPTKIVLVTEQQKTSKAMAALARLGAGNVVDTEQVPRERREYAPKPRGAVSEQTRNALRILEAAMHRKEEVEESDWR